MSADLAVRRLVRNCYMFSRRPCFPEGHPVQLPWRNGPSHQQEQQTPGWSLDGWFQRFLLYHITRYRAHRLAADKNSPQEQTPLLLLHLNKSVRKGNTSIFFYSFILLHSSLSRSFEKLAFTSMLESNAALVISKLGLIISYFQTHFCCSWVYKYVKNDLQQSSNAHGQTRNNTTVQIEGWVPLHLSTW